MGQMKANLLWLNMVNMNSEIYLEAKTLSQATCGQSVFRYRHNILTQYEQNGFNNHV